MPKQSPKSKGSKGRFMKFWTGKARSKKHNQQKLTINFAVVLIKQLGHGEPVEPPIKES